MLSREKIGALLRQMNESLTLLAEFKGAIEKKHTSYDSVCGRVQAAASPKQTVQFLLWITKNAHLLARHIPGFTRSQHHTPNVEFIAGKSSAASSSSVAQSKKQTGASSSSGVSSSAQAAAPAEINEQFRDIFDFPN